MDPFIHKFRVRYAELDPQAVVFNSRYLEYADILVTEFFRAQYANGMPEDLEFHVRRAEVDFLKPIRADEEIEGRLTVDRIGNSSMAMSVTLDGAGGAEDRRAIVTLLQVHVDLASGEPLRIPDNVRSAFGFELEGAANG